ncbi:MAG: hypothetical protein ACI808_000412 [Paraglaciecola sp.]|jgi:hypothetical protein
MKVRRMYNLTQQCISRSWTLIVASLILSACKTGGTSGNPNAVPVVPVPPYWESPTPDYSFDPDRPKVSLIGTKVIQLSVGGEYIEQGATANDLQDGDISAQISIDSQIDNTKPGDYLVRYQVSDSSQKEAFDAVRIVRVFDDSPVDISPRPFGSTQSHLGYVEYLPDDYGLDPDKKYPLLIYNHGNAANVEFSSDDPLSALGALLNNAGPPLLLNAGKWDPDLPFIVLVPQFGNVQNIEVSARINAFVDYAINTYSVDESRLYFTGWSQGGFLSFLYAVEYPERVAAIISISGGIPVDPDDLPENFCNIQNVPVWAFHGDQDDIVDVQSSIESIALIEANCQSMVLPRLTIFQGLDHVIHHSVFNLTAMQGGTFGAISDPDYDSYDQSIFDWLLSFDLDER